MFQADKLYRIQGVEETYCMAYSSTMMQVHAVYYNRDVRFWLFVLDLFSCEVGRYEETDCLLGHYEDSV